MDYSWCWHITSKNLVGFYCQEVDDDQQVVAVTNHIDPSELQGGKVFYQTPAY
jgi:hypothetical protein